MLTDIDLRVSDISLGERIKRLPSETRDTGRLFIEFALRAIQETNEARLALLVAEYPIFGEMLHRVEVWLSEGSREELTDLDNERQTTAKRKLLVFMAKMAGLRALAGAIGELDNAVWKASIAEYDAEWWNDVASACSLAAYLARRSDDAGLSAAEVMTQERLFDEIFGPLIDG